MDDKTNETPDIPTEAPQDAPQGDPDATLAVTPDPPPSDAKPVWYSDGMWFRKYVQEHPQPIMVKMGRRKAKVLELEIQRRVQEEIQKAMDAEREAQEEQRKKDQEAFNSTLNTRTKVQKQPSLPVLRTPDPQDEIEQAADEEVERDPTKISPDTARRLRVLRREFFIRSSKSTLALSLIWHLFSFSSELKDSISLTDLKMSSASK